MKSLLTWREPSYFEERKDHYFIADIIQLKICHLSYDAGFWFEYPGIPIKAPSTPCASLNDLYGTKIQYKGEPLIKGIIGGYGIINTPYLYIFWDQIPPIKDEQGKLKGFPCALPNIHDLELQPSERDSRIIQQGKPKYPEYRT